MYWCRCLRAAEGEQRSGQAAADLCTNVACERSRPTSQQCESYAYQTFATEMPPAFDSNPNRLGLSASLRRLDWMVWSKQANAVVRTDNRFRTKPLSGQHQFAIHRQIGPCPYRNAQRGLRDPIAIRLLRLNRQRGPREVWSVVIDAGWLVLVHEQTGAVNNIRELIEQGVASSCGTGPPKLLTRSFEPAIIATSLVLTNRR